MQWVPIIEVKTSGWTTLPLSAFSSGLDIDHAQGDSTTMTMRLARHVVPTNPNDWFLKPVRVSFSSAGQTILLFEGLIRSTRLDVGQGLVEYMCATPTQQLLVNSDAVMAELEAQVPWSTAVFGEREELTREEQFEKLLSASPYTVGSDGLQAVDGLVQFHKGVGEALGAPSSYNRFDTPSSVIAMDSPGGSIEGALSVDFSEPKLAATNGEEPGDPEAPAPSDAVAVPPVNRKRIKLVHRWVRLCQERFFFTYVGGNIVTDHAEVGTNFLTLQAVDDAVSQTGMHEVSRILEHPPVYGNVGSVGAPIYAGAEEGARGALVQSFTISVARRYIQQCEQVYERDVRCDESIERYGENLETVENTIEDDTDWSSFNTRELAPDFISTGYRDVRDAADFAAFGITSSATREEAEKALGVMVQQATRSIKLAHAATVTRSVGASTLINTSYSTPLSPDSASLDLGHAVGLQTPKWTVSGQVSGLVVRLAANGSATLDITLTTNVPPERSGTVVEVPPEDEEGEGEGELPGVPADMSYSVPGPVGYDGNQLPLVSFGGRLP